MGRRQGNRPPDALTREREAVAWSLAQTGATQERIAQQLDVDQGTISRLLNRLNDEYLKRNLDKVERVKVHQTRVYWHMVDESLQAWTKSKEPGRRARTQDGGPEVFDTIGREGDIRYLHAADKFMSAIRSIWGADVAPAQQDAALGIAQLIADLESRGGAFDARKQAEEPADPGSIHPGPLGGTPEVQAGPGAIQ